MCPGTQNGLSSTGSQENQYNLTKNRYNGCEIVMGNLEITQIESNWDFSFLKVTPRPRVILAISWVCGSVDLCFSLLSFPGRPSVR